jgi:hypothetical protein
MLPGCTHLLARPPRTGTGRCEPTRRSAQWLSWSWRGRCDCAAHQDIGSGQGCKPVVWCCWQPAVGSMYAAVWVVQEDARSSQLASARWPHLASGGHTALIQVSGPLPAGRLVYCVMCLLCAPAMHAAATPQAHSTYAGCGATGTVTWGCPRWCQTRNLASLHRRSQAGYSQRRTTPDVGMVPLLLVFGRATGMLQHSRGGLTG